MKCPKCQYIGYAQEDRCRNCGYDFSLSADLAELDLPIKTGHEALGPFADFALSERDLAAEETRDSAGSEVASASPTAPAPELPLFRDRTFDDDAPLVSLPASPRVPVSVRKSAPARAHSSRTVAREPMLDLGSRGEDTIEPRRATTSRSIEATEEEHATEVATAPAGARLLGAAVDLVLLGTVDATVLYLTLRLLGLDFSQVTLLPIVPFAAFIALLNGGYLAAFTAAGGQTIGKMAARTRVVTADESAWTDRVPLGQAVVRAAAYVISALPAGLGFLPAIVGADGRAIHDRLAHTRVVRA